MFFQRDTSVSELSKKQKELDAALKKAEESRKQFLAERVSRIRDRSKRTNAVRATDAKPSVTSSESGSCAELLKSNVRDGMHVFRMADATVNVEDFQTMMQSKAAIEGARAIVEGLENNSFIGDAHYFKGIKNRPKIFLSLALLAAYPDEMMPDPGPEEKGLLSLSAHFYRTVKNLFTRCNGHNKIYAKDYEAVAWEWVRAVNGFVEWSCQDKAILLKKMKTDFLSWVKKIGSWQRDHAHADWEPHVLVYQNDIVGKIFEVFGKTEVDKLISEVDEFNATFSEADMVIEMDTGHRYRCCWKSRAKKEEQSDVEYKTLLQKEVISNVHLTNVQILHELMLNEDGADFSKVLEMSGTSMEAVSEKTQHALMSLIALMEEHSNVEQIARVLGDLFVLIRSIILELAGDNSDYRAEVQLIDCELDPHDWLSGATQLLSSFLVYCRKCCAPARDGMCVKVEQSIDLLGETRGSSELITTFKSVLMELFELLNAMRADLCNFRMSLLVARIRGKGVAERYELEEFGRKFSSHPMTERWLRDGINASERPAINLANAYLKLLDPSKRAIAEAEIPETFHLDRQRLLQYQRQLDERLKLEAASLYIKNYCKEACGSGIAEVIKAIQFQMAQNAAQDQLQSSVYAMIDALGSENASMVKRSIQSMLRDPGSDKVFSLLRSRIMSKLRSRLNSESVAVPTGSGELEEKICNLFRYNKSTYWPIYDQILLDKRSLSQ